MTVMLVLAFLKKYWKYILGGILILVLIIFLLRACTPEPKINQEEIQKINSANEKERKEALQEVFKKIDTEQQVDDKKIAEADKKVEQSKKSTGKDITAEELEKLLKESK